MTLVFVKIRMLFSNPVILDVIVCVRNMLFKPNCIVDKGLLFACVNLGDEWAVKLGECTLELVAFNTIVLVLLQLTDHILS